jgi:small subunit ribosomal protein S7
MPRRRRVRARKVEADPIYGNVIVTKLINRSMKDGKKSVAQSQIYRAFEIISEKEKSDPISVFNKAIDNIKPTMEVRPRRIGGAAYQVPMPVRGKRQESLAIRWLVESSRNRPNKDFHTFADKLATEIIEASQGEGLAVKKREEIEKIAEANRAFAHFRW